MSETTQAKPKTDIIGYETTVITKSELSDDTLKNLIEKIGGVIKTFSGDVVLTEDWGKKKLAYSIGKESRGHYTYIAYSGKGNVVHEVERNLRLNEGVLRFLSVRLGEGFDGEEFVKTRAHNLAAAKKREEEKEARYAERRADRYSDRYDDMGGYDFDGSDE